MKKTTLIAFGVAAAMTAGGALYAGSAGVAEPALDAAGESEVETATGSVARTGPVATIYRDPGCGCCDSYGEYLEAHGFEVELVDDPQFDERAIAAGVPEQGLGCHHARIGGYVVDGLVPAEIIRRLLDERPAVTGITLPGMPANAPGMAPEKTGTLKVYAFGPEGVSVYSDE